MSLAVVGLSHHTAPIDVRERFVYGDGEARAALARLVDRGALREAVLLSTCNRTEIYGRLPDGGAGEADGESAGSDEAPGVRRVFAELRERSGMKDGELGRYVYVHRGRRAVAHLFRVAASLDSMVVGEAQIQGQVRKAYEDAASLEVPAAGPVLTRLFQSALSVGGRVRAQTQLGAGAVSVPSAAVELARKIFGPLRGRRALVLGTGEMSELAVTALAVEGVAGLTVLSRTVARARELADRFDAKAGVLGDLPAILSETDIIAAATAAPHPILTRALLERAIGGGRKRPLLIVDVALPRDVEPAVARIPGVFLYDMDDLRQIVDDNLERRRDELPAAERIVAEGLEDFWDWYAGLAVVPVIRALRGRAETLRQAEVAKAMRKLAHLSPSDRDVIEAMSRQLLNKVLHRPTVRLRDAASNGRGMAVVDATRYLFELTSREDADPS